MPNLNIVKLMNELKRCSDYSIITVASLDMTVMSLVISKLRKMLKFRWTVNPNTRSFLNLRHNKSFIRTNMLWCVMHPITRLCTSVVNWTALFSINTYSRVEYNIFHQRKSNGCAVCNNYIGAVTWFSTDCLPASRNWNAYGIMSTVQPRNIIFIILYLFFCYSEWSEDGFEVEKVNAN